MPGASTRIVQFTLMGALLGVALPEAIGSVAVNPSWPAVALCSAYVFQALNFFHGKVSTLEDEDYIRALTAQPRLALLDYALNLSIVVAQVLIAFLFNHPVLLAVANVAMRVLDLLLVLLTRQVSFSRLVRRAQKSWAIFDGISAGIWIFIASIAYHMADLPQQLTFVGCSFFLIIVADLVMDYSYNRDLYFTSPMTWDDFAGSWDDLQGELGDEYRRAIIGPALEKLLQTVKPSIGSLLDFGCGNGCISRWCARWVPLVVGVDSSDAMVRFARTYPTPPQLFYSLGDQNGLPGDFKDRFFDCFLSCFSHQDVGDLSAVVSLASDHLTSSGLLVFVAEDLDRLEESSAHLLTSRRWLDRKRREDRSRRQLVYWLGEGTGQRSQLPTITTIYPAESYINVARGHGFALRDSYLLQCTSSSSPMLRRYQVRPRFRLLVFERPGRVNPPC